MTKEEALQSLRSDSPHERLHAARYLASNSDLQDLATVRQTLSGETDAYVRSALEVVVSRLLDSSKDVPMETVPDADVPEDVIRKIKAQAVEEVAALLLHEVSSKVGLIANAAAGEFRNYAGSRTRKYVENLQRIFEGISQLKKATATPKPEQFDLAGMIDQMIAEEHAPMSYRITAIGPRPLMAFTDPTLLHFAVSNGLRNAVEASAEVSLEKESHPVVINWGETDLDFWVAIIDRGAGLPTAVKLAFEPGKSNKRGHIGYGLAIARQAMETLDGSVNLGPATDGGTRYELRWGK